MNSPGVLAGEAREAIRSLNHATLDPSTVSPAEVYDVLGQVSAMLHGTRQALQQISAGLAHRRDELGADCLIESPAIAVAVIAGAVDLAVTSILLAAHDVDRAHQSASHLYLLDDGSDD